MVSSAADEPRAEMTPARAETRLPVTPRALIVGVLGVAIACFVVSWAELVVTSIQIAICQFAPAAIGLLFVLVLANLLVRAVARRLRLRPHEIAIIYLMILVASLSTSRGLLERWIPTLCAVDYYSTESNHFDKIFYKHIPQWSVIFDVKDQGPQRPSIDFYEGLKAGRPIPWLLWLKPLSLWAIVILALWFATACMATILRRQWVDNEKLTFPLVYLPVEVANDAGGLPQVGSFLRNRMTWIGFAIPTIVFAVNGLHEQIPSVPLLKLQHPWNPFFNTMGRPWKDLGYTTVYASMAAVGFSYFIPAQVLLALFSMFWLSRLENIMFSAFGKSFEAMPMYPTSIWNGYHVMGAYMVLTVYLIKSALPHLRQVWAEAFSPAPVPAGGPAGLRETEGREFLSYRTAIIGLGVSSLVAIVWFMKLGLSPWMAVVEYGVFQFVVVLVMARSVSEAGMLMTETSFRPVDVVRIFTTQRSLGASTLTGLAALDSVFTRDLRGNLLSTFMDGLKMSDVLKIDRRHLFWAIALALGVTLVWGSFLHLELPYRRGAITLYGYSYQWNAYAGYRHFAPVLDNTDKFEPRLGAYFLGGVAFATFLAWMRTQYAWWPFSPLAFALSGSWSMIVFWFPIFIAWVIKSLVLRYGGMKTYSNLRPFFLGLILGEFSQAVLWAALGAIWRLRAPFFPWP
ncbi:MAG: hypothetical protein KKI08_23805 [Armatimonadetes bacterium]|nr:hypothetical protein [Armatimonadota bacterium]